MPFAASAAVALTLAGGVLPARATSTLTTSAAAPRSIVFWNADMARGTADAPPESWTATPARATSTASVHRVNGPAYFGTNTKALQIIDAGTRTATVARSAPIDATAGRRYVSNVNVYVGSGKAPTFYLEFLDAEGTVVGRVASTTTPPAAGHGRWMQVKATAPRHTTRLRAVFYSTQAGRTKAYYRTPNITESDPGTTYQESLGAGPVLFIGNERVASTTMTQVVHPGEKYDGNHDGQADPVYDVRFSGRTSTFQQYHSAQLGGTVMYDSQTERYRMWFIGQKHGETLSDTWGNTSADGIAWSWGSKQSTGTSLGANVAGVVPNRNRSDTARRYLMLAVNGLLYKSPESAVSYRAYGSADGTTWKPLTSRPVLPGRDVASVTYDPVSRRYLATSKQASGSAGRQFFVSTSSDFIHWTTPRVAFHTDAKDPAGSEVYQAPTFRYGEQTVAMPLIYNPAAGNGRMAPSLASATDTDHFTRATDRRPVIPLGRPTSSTVSSDGGFIILPSGPVVDRAGSVTLINGKVRMYYTGWNGGHDGTSPRRPAVFMAQWRQDGFTSMHATGTKTLTTKSLRPTGRNLNVNARLAATGRLSVAVLDPRTGRPYPGFADEQSTVVTGDHTAATVTWGGHDLSALAGEPVALRFTMTDGDLYSFRIR